jgi:hypothetical protein
VKKRREIAFSAGKTVLRGKGICPPTALPTLNCPTLATEESTSLTVGSGQIELN